MNNSISETPTPTHSYSTTPSPSTSSLTTQEARVPGSEIVLPLAVTLVTISSICTSYVIIRTLIRWWNTRRSLSMALRVPFYIAISDFLLVSNYLPNLIYPLIHGYPWPEPQCRIIGGITFFFISCNMSLVGSLALLTYLRICRRWYIDLGKYDYRLFCFLITSSFVYTIIGIPSFGASKYWCFTNHNSAIMPVITLTLNFTILAISLFSYTMTLRQINSINFRQEHPDTAATKSKQIEPVVVRKIVGYVLIFLFQWTPPMIYVFCQVIKYDDMWIYIVTDATINLGGVGNMIQYIINEGWWDNRDSTAVDSNSTPPMYNLFSGILSSSAENNRKSQMNVTVKEVVTIVIEESPPLSTFDANPTDSDAPTLSRSRPNSIVTFNIDRDDGVKELSSSPAIKITAPSPTMSTPSPTILSTITHSPTVSTTTYSQAIRTTQKPTHNLVQTSPRHINESSDRIHVSELEQIIIHHNKDVLKHDRSFPGQDVTVPHRSHSLRRIRSEESVNRSLANIQDWNDYGDSNGGANIEFAEGVGRFVNTKVSMNRSKSLNSGSSGRSRNGSLSGDSCRGRSGSESSNKGLIEGESVNSQRYSVKQNENPVNKEEDDSYFPM